MNQSVFDEIGVSGILVFTLTVAFFLMFLAAYRARASMWLGPPETIPHVDTDEFARRRRTSGGLYLLETLVLAAFCFLLAHSLRLLGLDGAWLYVASAVACSLVVLGVAPLSLRPFTARQVSPERIVPVPRFLLKTALFLRDLSLRGFDEAAGPGPRAVPLDGKHGRDFFKVLSRLRERQISEMMSPRVDMVCADECSTISELADLVRESGHTRIPIFAGTIDSVTGYVTAKDVVLRLHKGGGEQIVSSIARHPTFVRPVDTIENTLKAMQRTGVTLAIVSDSAGGTLGLVTSEDILEEIVGDLYEDYEPEEPAYQVVDDRTALVRGNVAVEDLKEIFGVVPLSQRGAALGEYVRDSLGADAVVGDSVSDDVFSYTVVRTTGKAIWSVRVEKKV
ncbi:MAG: CBS domain-containing protein [Candidatus Eiseniibacteriota bacterium]|nr:MAG: CBS domain-containing protein [Candidatus Eisenbacteria bacterium]